MRLFFGLRKISNEDLLQGFPPGISHLIIMSLEINSEKNPVIPENVVKKTKNVFLPILKR